MMEGRRKCGNFFLWLYCGVANIFCTFAFMNKSFSLFVYLVSFLLVPSVFCSSLSVEPDGRVDLYDYQLTSLTVDGRDLRPTESMLRRAREEDKHLYLRFMYLDLVGGGTEYDLRWFVRSSDPSTYAIKVSPSRGYDNCIVL